MAVFYLFAGINGSGKTSFYKTISEGMDLGERVSIDETASLLGSWLDPVIQVRAGRIALQQAFDHIDAGVTFNQETTLPGAVIERQLREAKAAGFTVILYFLGVDTVETAIERVRRRVAKGGHGIPESLIRRRWENMPAALGKILPYCDLAYFYDNTECFRQIVLLEGTRLVDADPALPDWFYYVTGRKRHGFTDTGNKGERR